MMLRKQSKILETSTMLRKIESNSNLIPIKNVLSRSSEMILLSKRGMLKRIELVLKMKSMINKSNMRDKLLNSRQSLTN